MIGKMVTMIQLLFSAEADAKKRRYNTCKEYKNVFKRDRFMHGLGMAILLILCVQCTSTNDQNQSHTTTSHVQEMPSMVVQTDKNLHSKEKENIVFRNKKSEEEGIKNNISHQRRQSEIELTPSIESETGNSDKEHLNKTFIRSSKVAFEKNMLIHIKPLALGFKTHIEQMQEQVASLEYGLSQERREKKKDFNQLPSKLSAFVQRKTNEVENQKSHYNQYFNLFDREETVLDDIQTLNKEIYSLYSHYITTPVKTNEMFYKHLLAYRALIGCIATLDLLQSDLRLSRDNQIKDRKITLISAEQQIISLKETLKDKKKNIYSKISKQEWELIYGSKTLMPLYVDIAKGYFENNKFLINNYQLNLSKVKVNELEVALLCWMGAWAKATNDPRVKKNDKNILIKYSESVKL